MGVNCVRDVPETNCGVLGIAAESAKFGEGSEADINARTSDAGPRFDGRVGWKSDSDCEADWLQSNDVAEGQNPRASDPSVADRKGSSTRISATSAIDCNLRRV